MGATTSFTVLVDAFHKSRDLRSRRAVAPKEQGQVSPIQDSAVSLLSLLHVAPKTPEILKSEFLSKGYLCESRTIQIYRHAPSLGRIEVDEQIRRLQIRVEKPNVVHPPHKDACLSQGSAQDSTRRISTSHVPHEMTKIPGPAEALGDQSQFVAEEARPDGPRRDHLGRRDPMGSQSLGQA